MTKSRISKVKFGLLLMTICCVSFATEIPRDSQGKIKRSSYVLKQFEAKTPRPACPVTALLGCPTWIKDHIVPLCAGGEDKVYNLKWSEFGYSLLRDSQERELCDELRRRYGKVHLLEERSHLCGVIKDGNLTLLGEICK